MNQIKGFSPSKIIGGALKILKPKEIIVLESRFGLKGDFCTLAKIGRNLKLSRERVRQIEKEALKKLSLNIVKNHQEIVEQVLALFQDRGGYMSKKETAKHILEASIHKSHAESRALDLFIYLVPKIGSIERHATIHDSWVLRNVKTNDMAKILKNWAEHLAKNKKPQKIDLLLKKQPKNDKYKISFLLSLPKVSRDIIETYSGELALSCWSDYNPKTVRDKIYFVLKKNQSPMHFMEISRAIKQEEFDKKAVISATVHNELISDNRFVLVGRGIYALKEWGYKSGTVKDVIKRILKEAGGAMEANDIYEAVIKQRVVRKNTIVINLQTQKEFKKIGANKYILV